MHIYARGAATQTYTYDADGNWASYFDNATPPVSLAYNYDTASNRLLGISGSSKESFTYDSTGNMLSHSSPFADFRYDYDARNRLAVSWSGAAGTTQLINGLGQRVGRTGEDAPIFFAYDEAGHLTGQYGATGSAVAETVWLGDLPVAVLSPTGRFYIAPDHLGAPHQITNAAGQVVWLWDHDPFGNGDPVVTGGFSYSLRFPGQFYDARARLHYNYFRDYDPRTGRYIESDPIGLAGGINTYGYVGGNPLDRTDMFGLDWTQKFVDSLPDQWVDRIAGWGDLWIFQPEVANSLTGFEYEFSFHSSGFVYDKLGLGDQINKCSTAYQRGKLAGTVAGFGISAMGLGKVIPELRALKIGKNGLYYQAGRQGALSFAAVSTMWKELWENEAHLLADLELLDGGSECGCSGQ